jgi:hypothetical protein
LSILFLAQMAHGLRQDRDDVINLHYAPLHHLPEPEESEEEELEEYIEEQPDQVISAADGRFLPPFPSNESPEAQAIPPPQLPPTQPLKVDKPPIPLSGSLTTTSAFDYLTRVPYSQSTLSSTPEWHLPLPPPPQHPQANVRRLATPQTQQALIAAYHHVLTHPPAPNANIANPPRHKVAMALLTLTQTSSRWDVADTLYSSVAPCPPRVAAIAPTYPIPITSGNSTDLKAGKEDDRDRKLPPAFSRPVSATERLTPLASQQPSRIPDLARLVLPVSGFASIFYLFGFHLLSRVVFICGQRSSLTRVSFLGETRNSRTAQASSRPGMPPLLLILQVKLRITCRQMA